MGSTTPEFAAELERVKQIAPLGARYHHYKHTEKRYKIVLHGFWEATGEPAIAYQLEYGDKTIWIRTSAVFLEEVEWEGKKVPRFTRIS